MFRVTLLAIIAGYADTVGYLHLNAFAGLMTGNTILMGIELATAKYRQAAFHGAIIAMFLFEVIFGRMIVRQSWKFFEHFWSQVPCSLLAALAINSGEHCFLRLEWGFRTRPPIGLGAS